jgi:hypothetical protein
LGQPGLLLLPLRLMLLPMLLLLLLGPFSPSRQRIQEG